MMELLKKYQTLIYQFFRFAGIGFLNSAVDFAVLNVLIVASGVSAGFSLSLLNAISFSMAVIHSYVWNKYWAFGSSNESTLRFLFKVIAAGFVGVGILAAVLVGANKEASLLYFLIVLIGLAVFELLLWLSFHLKTHGLPRPAHHEFGLFLAVSIGGILINSGAVGLITGLVHPVFGLNDQLWANLAKVVATAIAMAWNFVGYKLLVFKR